MMGPLLTTGMIGTSPGHDHHTSCQRIGISRGTTVARSESSNGPEVYRRRGRATIPPVISATLQREHWNGQPTHLGDLFRVGKMRGDKQLGAVCELWTHNFGWQVRLTINGDLQRSQVFRSQDDVLTADETWKAAMIEKGWS